MTIFERLWSWLSDLLAHFWDSEAPALEAWLKQFANDEGKIILADAATYGPQILSGSISITDAATKLGSDLAAKGITDAGNLSETIFNALRTQTNAAATTVAPTV